MPGIMIVLLSISGWIGAGALCIRRTNNHALSCEGDHHRPGIALVGPLMLIHVFMQSWEGHDEPLWLTRRDRRNPSCDELKDALRAYRRFHLLPGESAGQARDELVAVIKALRQVPSKLNQYDADKFVAAMRSETECVIRLSGARLEACEVVERLALAELSEAEIT